MTQIDPNALSPAERIEPDNNKSKDARPTNTDPTSIESKPAEEAPPDAHAKEKDTPTTVAADDSNTDYRAPEAIPLPKSEFSIVGGSWTDYVTEDAWPQDQDDGGWGNNIKQWDPETYEEWGPVQPNPSQWKNLGVIGTDDPSRDSERWWDPAVQRTKRKPGPGMLAPRAIETMHDSDHVLYEVSITGNPTSESSAALSPKSSITSAGALNSSAGAPLPVAPTSPPSTSVAEAPPTTEAPAPDSPALHVPPTLEEIRNAIPHPSALFCRQHHGWVILAVTTASATASHLSAHWCNDPGRKSLLNKLPDPSLRTEKNCSDLDSTTNNPSSYPTWNWSQSSGQKMHHFHRYPNVVAGSGLFPALKRPKFLSSGQPTATLAPESSQDAEMAPEGKSQQNEVQDDEFRSSWEQAPTSEYLDLYLCCQCKTQILCSPDGNVIPGVIPVDTLAKYIQDRASNPKPGQSKEQSALVSLETILRIIEEPLWLGNDRALTTTGKSFGSRVGWNELSRRIFESMGFILQDNHLSPPSLTTSTPEGQAARLKLLRVWVEIGAVIADYCIRYSKLAPTRKNYIRLTNSRESLAERLGSNPDKMPRVDDIRAAGTVPQRIWDLLGITRATATPTVIETAYHSQIRCDPAETPTYYGVISELSRQPQFPNVSAIESLVATESSKGRWGYADLQTAAERLGFGINNVIGVDYIPEETDDDYIITAFQAAHKLASVDAVKRSNIKNSLKILAESRKSHKLMKHYEEIAAPNYMDIEEAYKVLEVNKNVDDDTLVVVYQVRIDDSPYSKERMKAALLRVAEERNSTRLRELVETGIDPGKPPVFVPMEYPRGLQQLGNTCYLNSLLQYFYTIKELREVIVNGNFNLDTPISDEDLLKHRIGGRLVTRREVERSKQFVKLLSGLFTQMLCAEEPAITPDIELAKLALVTSKDEEDDAAGKTVTAEPGEITDNPAGKTDPAQAVLKDTSTAEKLAEHMDTDPSTNVEVQQPADVRPSGEEELPVAMEESQDVVMASRPVSPPHIETNEKRDADEEMQPPTVTIADSADKAEAGDADDDDKAQQADTSADSMVVETGDEPPNTDEVLTSIAARKKTTMAPDSGAMMFGKQHDVSEVFDNCMFQIETALRFEKPDNSDDAGSGTIKKLFYGKLLQRLSPIVDPMASPTSSKMRAATVHEKEDLYSHLLVNVSDEGFDLYDGLSGYFEDEVEHGGKRSRMDVSLLDLPPILQIQLQRVQFNRETMQAFKSNAYVKFEETLVMDRFLANADLQKKTESKSMERELSFCRERLRTLGQSDLTPSIAGAKSFLSSLKKEHHEIDDELIGSLGDEITSIEEEITQTRTRCQQLKEKIETFWKDEREAEYQLASVFIHRGTSPSFGHYFFYSRHLPEKPDEWFKYNDSEVTPVSKEEVLADGTGSTANPYLLVYVRKGHDVIDTIHRVAVSD